MRHVTLTLLASFLSMGALIGGPGGVPSPEDQDPPNPDEDPTRMAPEFVRGDVDQDGEIDASDPVEIMKYLFTASTDIPCLDAADADDSGTVNISDVTYLTTALWLGGPPPPPPMDTCGPDPTEDELPPCEFDACALWSSVGSIDPGKWNPLWENWFLWVFAYEDFRELSVWIEEAAVSDPVLKGALSTDEVELLLRETDRIVILTSEDEEETLLWITEKQRELARRSAPIYLFLEERSAGAALLVELVEGGRLE